MTKDKTVTMSRELIEVVAKEMDRLGYGHHEHHAESILCAIIAAPVVERQEPVDALLLSDCVEHLHKIYGGGYFGTEVVQLYTSPPAPVAVPDGWKLVPLRPTMDMLDALMEWSKVGNVNAYNNILEAAPTCLDKVKELNQ